MSDMETWKVAIKKEPVDVEEVKVFYKGLGHELPDSFSDSWEFENWLDDIGRYKKFDYFNHKGLFYKIETEEMGEDWSIVKTEQKEGFVGYMLNFYNGGTSLSEQLAELIERENEQ